MTLMSGTQDVVVFLHASDTTPYYTGDQRTNGRHLITHIETFTSILSSGSDPMTHRI